MTERTILRKFYESVEYSTFYMAADSIIENIQNPKIVAKCAEVAAHRQPGGDFYQRKLWARVSELLEEPNGRSPKATSLNSICYELKLSPVTARKYINIGKIINELEYSGTDTSHLHSASLTLFKNAQRQKIKTKEYLIKAIGILKENPNFSAHKIHTVWCQENGSIKANLDIIKPSDWWAFSHPKWRKLENFPGSIPGEIYANALYYFSPPKGIAVDPMAGSGMLKRVYQDRQLWQKDSNFQLKIHLYDLYPAQSFIKKHDARKPLPIKADWIFLDPPYFGQANHLYRGILAKTQDYSEYLKVLNEIIISMFHSLNEQGRLCILLPKWSGFKPDDPNYDIPRDAYNFAIDIGLEWIDEAFVSRGRQQEPGSANKNNQAKRIRRMRSDTCVLNVFQKNRSE